MLPVKKVAPQAGWLWFAVSVPLYVAYLLTLSPTVPLEDGGEMIRAAFTLGVTHPPGYPLYTLLGRLACLLPVGDIAFRMNLLSAALSACGCGIAACAAYRLMTTKGLVKPGKAPYAWWGAAIADVLMGATPALWWQSVIAEKYAMNYCFSALIIAALIAGLAHFKARALPILGFIYGLSASHHGQTVYFAPAVLLALWWLTRRLPRDRRARAVAVVVFMVTLGLSIKFVYPPVRAAQQPLHNWGNPSTWPSYTDYVSGQPYQYRILYWGPVEIARRFVDHTLRFLPKQFGWPGVAAGLLGLLWLIRTRPREAIILGSIWATGVVYCLNFSLPGFAIRTYYIPTFLVFSLWIAFGLVQAGTWVGGLNRVVRIPVLVAALGWLLWPVVPHRFESDRSRHYFAYDFSRAVLKSVEPRCLLIAWADYDLFPLWYQQDILGVQRGVTLVDAQLLPEDEVKNLGRRLLLIYPPQAKRFEKQLAYAEDLERVRPGLPVYFSLAFTGVKKFRKVRAHFLSRGAAYRYIWDQEEFDHADVLAEWGWFKRWRTVRGVHDQSIAKDHNTQKVLGYYAYADFRRGYLLSERSAGCHDAMRAYGAALAWPFWDSIGPPAAHAALARCWEALGNLGAALKEYEEAVRLAPEWTEARRSLLTLQQAQGEP